MTKATSVQWRGEYMIVEVWADKERFRVTFDRYLNLVRVQRFDKRGTSYLDYWYWRQEWHRHYRSKGRRSLKPILVDVVCCASESAKSVVKSVKRKKEKATP